jgi:glutamate 5-kinase
MRTDRKASLAKIKRVVIKVGSSLLADPKTRRIQGPFLNALAKQVSYLQGRGFQCVIVTSGAIAAGMFELGLKKRPSEIARLQALAAVGQSNLMHAYEATFERYHLKVAQILLTWEDLSHRNRYSNAHNTLNELFKDGIVPVVNENDTVAVEEIKLGNNDILAVLVTHLSEADLLVVLTDMEGLHTEDPRFNPKARIIHEVTDLTKEMERSATRTGSQVGTGGMATKLQAAKNMMRSGVPMVIAGGRTKDVLRRLLAGERVGTFFFPGNSKMNSRKRWLAWGVKPKGEIRVDEGARSALIEKDKSLLPGGVRGINGSWSAGEVVVVLGPDGREIARGIANYASSDLEQVKGLRTSEIYRKLGRKLSDEVVHRDNLVKTDAS